MRVSAKATNEDLARDKCSHDFGLASFKKFMAW
jgi:hypothetical protein